MPTSFWRSVEAQEQLNRLDRSGFAMEFLRRNPDYRKDWSRMRRRIAQGTLGEDAARSDLARRWGLSFCP
ncbi:conserved hypothetical protein [Methylocella tundrae]|uniref:Transcriptional regulator-like domain-containing protein n=1 Tax=Methylocella tundrae TaxID=227605 RepID=A0A8B6M6Q6_METTU|nr:DUF6499 domain-containing protein [Methylocella tundrae]VTZ26136.1 conserved hypothetical protein [Methylocella tundrae]VTZ50516.1 conserved hypothetical protein [Methylocella tundrae]